MSRWLSNPDILLDQAAVHGGFAERGDLAGLARSVMEAACHNGSMTGPGAEVMTWLRRLPDPDRLELAGIWAEWHARTAAGEEPSPEAFRRNTSYLRAELLVVATGVARGLDPELMAAERQAVFTQLASEYVAFGHREWELADAEIEAGRIPAPAVLAAFRRTLIDYHAEPALRELLTRFPGPVLNPGEAWADQALEDAAGGVPWQRLLGHRAPISAGAPSAKWLDAGRELLDAAGPESVRRRVHGWFELVGRERTVPLRGSQGPAAYDPYNVQALRALAWLLSLLPPRDDTCDALARLVGTSLRGLPRSGAYAVRVAEAGVVALARIGTGDARLELDGLRRHVTHKTVLRRIDRALAA